MIFLFLFISSSDEKMKKKISESRFTLMTLCELNRCASVTR